MNESMKAVDASVFDVMSNGECCLWGVRCAVCSTVGFPATEACSKCSATDMHQIKLANAGVLWSWTVQRFPPVSPPYQASENFEPFAVGYIELPDQLRIEARLLGDVDAGFVIGEAMQLCALPVFEDEEGAARVTYAFARKELINE
jgi:uncharacterized OB-fold protein